MPHGEPSWSELATARLYPLWRHMPARPRAGSEAGFVVTAVLAPSVASALEPACGPAMALGLPLLTLGAWGASLLRGGARWATQRATARAVGIAALLCCVVGTVLAPWLLLGDAVGQPLPRPGGPPAPALGANPLTAMTMRNLCVLGLVALVLRGHRQGVAQLGLPRRGLGQEALFGLVGLVGAFALHLGVSLLLAGILGLASPRSISAEAAGRASTVVELVSTTHLPVFAVLLVLAAAFEEVVFRGFVLPRTQHALGSWPLALGLVSGLFGLGHLYEGPLAVVQTATLGLYFGLLLVWRAHLLGAIVAHAGFNAVMVALVLGWQASGLFRSAPPWGGP